MNWMPAPQAPLGCPPGLEYLTAVDQILVHQLVELVEGKESKFCRRNKVHAIQTFQIG